VVTAGEIVSLTLTITNTRRAPITFEPDDIGGESDTHTGAVFYIHCSMLVEAGNVGAIRLSAVGWQFRLLDDASQISVHSYVWCDLQRGSAGLLNAGVGRNQQCLIMCGAILALSTNVFLWCRCMSNRITQHTIQAALQTLDLDGAPVCVHASLRQLAQHNGFILLIGVGLDKLTLLHMAEKDAG
jgi:hypothetical protein